jgi:HlyD family secretion protein/adhesin transport system membrane fusion protein
MTMLSTARLERAPQHLTQSIALEEARLPRLTRNSTLLAGLALAAFFAWSAVTSVEEIATSLGDVVPTGRVQSIQHLDGGVVKEITVRDGDLVQAGQLIIQLDATSAKADLGQSQARLGSLEMQATRLRQFVNIADISGRSLSDDERAILASMEEARETQRTVLMDQIDQKSGALKQLRGVRRSLQQNLDIQTRENAMRQTMAQRGLISKLDAMASQRELNDLEGRLNETIQQENQAESAIAEAQNKIVSLDADLKQQAMKELGTVEGDLAETKESIAKYQGIVDRARMTAPITGIVSGLNVNAIGAVVEAGKVVLQLVPADQELVVESNIAPSDMGNVQTGELVRVKVSAYDFARHGAVTGRLESISATTFQTEDGKSFFKARIKLDQPYVGKDAARNPILPGMTVQADIVTGQKTILEYLLRPIQLAAETGFHET